MTYRRNGMGQFLKRSKVLIENARGVPEIAQVLTGYGYTAETLGLGAGLLAEVEALASKREMDTGESRQATGALNSAWEQADDAYLKALKVARAAFGQNPKASAALKLYGARKQSIAGWLDQARTFFANLQGDAQLCEGMKVYGYTPGKIAARAALVEGVRMKLQSHTEESGAAHEERGSGAVNRLIIGALTRRPTLSLRGGAPSASFVPPARPAFPHRVSLRSLRSPRPARLRRPCPSICSS